MEGQKDAKDRKDLKGLTYAERCMALVDSMREISSEDPGLILLLQMFDVLEK